MGTRGEPQVTVGVRLPPDTVAKIDEAAEALGLERSEYVRMAMDSALKTRFSAKTAAPYRRRKAS